MRDGIQYGHLKVTYTYSPHNKVYYWVASWESFTSLAKSSTWWSCEHWSQISCPFYPNPCSCALQHSPTSTSHSSANSTLNKCRIKNVQPQKPISLLLPSPTRVVISEKSFGFLPSVHVNLETTQQQDSDHSCNYKNSVTNHDQGRDSQRLKVKYREEPMP